MYVQGIWIPIIKLIKSEVRPQQHPFFFYLPIFYLLSFTGWEFACCFWRLWSYFLPLLIPFVTTGFLVDKAILDFILLATAIKSFSMLVFYLALVSIKIALYLAAIAYPSSFFTTLSAYKSSLFATMATTVLSGAWFFTSDIHFSIFSNVFRSVILYA